MSNSKYIFDYISGKKIIATPEEVESVQVFSRMLVQDYGYLKEQIVTRPQWHVKSRPSDTQHQYPVDIAVFNNENHTDSNLYMVVECKRKNVEDGKAQLKDYMRFSSAQLGVWFNGDSAPIYLKKIETSNGIEFEEIPNIPSKGQRVEDIGKYRKNQLKEAKNLKALFKNMRNYLAANAVGATRDETLAQQLINLIFCKIHDEKNTKSDDMLSFRVSIGENPRDVKDRIIKLFDGVKKTYIDVMDENDSISLDDKSIAYIVATLQNFALLDSNRDAVGDAFEVFFSHTLKGGQGQFFTPRNVVKMIVDIIDPSSDDRIIDPACGSGGFLVESLKHVWNKIEIEGAKRGLSDIEIFQDKQESAQRCFRGMDKDYFLTKLCKAYMAILRDGRGGIYCENSLEVPTNWQRKTQDSIKLNSFSVVLANPPYGSKMPVDGKHILEQYEVGHKWKYSKKKDKWEKGKLETDKAPQYLFIERCLQLLEPGGRLGIVLPDGILGNDQLGYIREIILNTAKVIAIIDIPLETFMPHTSTKTSVLILKKYKKYEDKDKEYPIFMAICEKCGHDRRGNSIDIDDLESIPKEFLKWKVDNNVDF